MTNNVETKLIIGGDSATAEAAVKGTISELEKLRREAEAPLAKIGAVEEMRAGLDSLNTGVIKSTQQLERERAQLAKLEAELRAAGVDTKNLAAEKTRLEQKSITAARHIDSMKGSLAQMREEARKAAASTREAGDAAATTGSKSGAAVAGVKNLAGAFGVLSAVAVAREFIQANASMESMTLALENVTGSSGAAAAEMGFVREEAARLGLELTAAASSYTQLAASAKGTALEGPKTREIWSAVAESMARLGKTSAETDGALLAISQMMSKGVVAAEELRGQLGERMPGAFAAAARAMGTTTQGLGEMLQKGEVIAEDFLPKFAAELRKLGGGEINSFNANLSRLKNAFNEVFLSFGDTGAFKALGDGLRYASVAVLTAWEGFELLGKTLANIAYTVATLDFSGYQKRQREALEAARADVAKVMERLIPLGQAIDDAGSKAEKTGERIRKAFGGETEAKVEDLGKAFKEIGLDMDEVRTGISSTERKIIESFNTIARDKNVSGEVIVSAFLTALDKVKDKAAPELTRALSDAFGLGKVSVDLFNSALDATVTKSDYLSKNLASAMLDNQKKIDEALKVSLKRREQIEADFAKRRADLNKPEGADEASFGNLFALQSRARQLSVDAGRATGEEAQRLSDEALATARQAADMVEALKKAGDLNSTEASGFLRGVEDVAVQSAEALKNVPITLDAAKAKEEAQRVKQIMQEVFDGEPLRVRVVTESSSGAGGSVGAQIRDAALQVGR